MINNMSKEWLVNFTINYSSSQTNFLNNMTRNLLYTGFTETTLPVLMAPNIRLLKSRCGNHYGELSIS